MGKAKIKRDVDEFCKELCIETLAESTIGKVIKRNNLFFAGESSGRQVAPNLT